MLSWSDIDTVFLDMDGTLLDLHFDSHFWLTHLPRRYAEIKNIPESKARDHLKRWIDCERGTLNWYCVDYWSERLEVDVGQLKTEVRNRIAYRASATAFLAWLAEAPQRVVLVTNAHPKSLSLKIAETGLDRYFERLITTHDKGLGLPKENPAFWTALQDTEPFDPQRTLLIDDSLPVLTSARTYGIRHLITILSPDSTAPHRPASDFPGIHDFGEIMPR
ncbi:GMP/IMP nucleotidase [Mangrovitalea sediminis]|uniref:GMP/IMP nucleotidase n=1 Tax=Mangrovitalea sediminis TaxID=1982043 RepID=UPI000BE4C8D0|nr:GMP/IMP nucleotidase [Mangrovitalea sediminis]